MQTQPLETDVEITSALTVEELEQVKAKGFKAVICNCKPGESAEFPGEDAYRRKAADIGLQWVHIPVTPGDYSQADIAAFAEALQQLPRPILAFCRTGKRATHLWAYAKRQTEQCDLA
ncbi:sulfur transferase domain-containing protein [Halomonas sp. QHL1]|uniref:beta-lactamase hydrolase domain-containing protein n=1 Tax=Halomonas sp. QHL1 TaxID=1123773 RepID=UPI000AFEB829|nr:sulfur transferase domain-containing protein [Halomonas sp. QHL1]